MEITDKMEHVRGQVRQHRTEGKLDQLQRENLRLETETRMLHDELRDERGALATRMKALERSSKAGVPRHRLRRFLALTGVAVGAYTLGAKAGRERYEDIKAAWQKATRSGRSAVQEARERADDAIDEAQVVSARLSDAGQVLGETAKTVVEGRANGSTDVDPSLPPRSG